jgi:type I restriction-modification system DNA methylase subunit
MGRIFEHLIYRFNQENNQTSGEHFTPRSDSLDGKAAI